MHSDIQYVSTVIQLIKSDSAHKFKSNNYELLYLSMTKKIKTHSHSQNRTIYKLMPRNAKNLRSPVDTMAMTD